jgi:PAS domain S-box-containing protein
VTVSAVASCPADFTLAFHESLSDSYEMSKVLLATADFDGTLQLLTSGWERALGYGREELAGKTLGTLMWSDRRRAAAAVAAILDRLSTGAVDVRVRCRNGLGKCFRLHRRYDRREQMFYIVAEETPDKRTAAGRDRAERRSAARAA